jgi:hypothetical protein
LTRPLPRPIAILLIALVIVRVASVTWSATGRTRGDFYASMPGAYVETLNPVLWDSPDMTGAWGYHNHTYYHGPIQYLTLYPIAFFDTFAQIAFALLPLYFLLLCGTFWMLWRLARRLGASDALFVPLLASMFLFFPVLQAYLQREFEVVLTFALTAALLSLVNDRRGRAAAWLAYAAWFKYIPLMFAGYLFLRRWWKELGIFAAVSAVILLASHALFDLSRFFNNNVPGHAAQVFNVWGFDFKYDATGHLYGTGFCEGWFDNESTLSNLRHGLCTISAYNRWVNPPVIYLAVCAAVAALYLWTHFRLERRVLSVLQESRRRALEFSIITTICSCFFFSHYYYLIALVIPYSVLLVLYLADRRYRAFGLWAISYFLVSAFVVPMTILNRLAGYDMWEPYIWKAWFWYGEMLLVGLLMFEYGRLVSVTPAAGSAAR